MTLSEKKIKQILTNKFGNACWGCNDPVSADKHLVLDHIIPQRDGGSDTIENRALLCYDCNQKKGSKLTLDGLREITRVKNHTIDLKGAMQWTREQAMGTLIGDQLLLRTSNREEPQSHKITSAHVALAMPDFDDSDVSGLKQIRGLMWLRGHHEVAKALGRVSHIEKGEDNDGWQQITNVALLIHADAIKEYNYLVNLDDSVQKEIERATREVTWTLGELGGFKVLLDIPGRRQVTPMAPPPSNGYDSDDVDDLPF